MINAASTKFETIFHRNTEENANELIKSLEEWIEYQGDGTCSTIVLSDKEKTKKNARYSASTHPGENKETKKLEKQRNGKMDEPGSSQ